MHEQGERMPKKDQIKLFMGNALVMGKALGSQKACDAVMEDVNDWLGEMAECIEVVRITLYQESGIVMVHYRINK